MRMLANQRAAKLATNWRLWNGRVMMRIAWLHCGLILHVIRLSATVRHDRGKMGFFWHWTNVNPLDINKSLLQNAQFWEITAVRSYYKRQRWQFIIILKEKSPTVDMCATILKRANHPTVLCLRHAEHASHTRGSGSWATTVARFSVFVTWEWLLSLMPTVLSQRKQIAGRPEGTLMELTSGLGYCGPSVPCRIPCSQEYYLFCGEGSLSKSYGNFVLRIKCRQLSVIYTRDKFPLRFFGHTQYDLVVTTQLKKRNSGEDFIFGMEPWLVLFGFLASTDFFGFCLFVCLFSEWLQITLQMPLLMKSTLHVLFFFPSGHNLHPFHRTKHSKERLTLEASFA